LCFPDTEKAKQFILKDERFVFDKETLVGEYFSFRNVVFFYDESEILQYSDDTVTEEPVLEIVVEDDDDDDHKVNDVGNEEEEGEVVPAQDIEGEGFNDDVGDFESQEEGDIEEEIDLSAELRLLADRLSEIADKLSVNGEEEMGAEEQEGEMGMGGEEQ
jgi:hypothetical protein